MESLKVVGRSFPRRESIEKVIGAAQYTDDLHVPNMVYGRILRSPWAHARVIGIDTKKAMAVPGVLGILLPEDVPATRFNCSGNPPGPLLIKDERVLTDEPLHVGDRVAAVAALTPEAALEALHKIEVEYEPLEAVIETEAAIAPGAPLVHPELFDSNIFKTLVASQGDVEAGFRESDHIFEEEFRTPAVQHVALEPVGCICDYAPDGRVTIWSNTQAPFQDRRILAELLELPESSVRMIKPVMGGGFGGRQQLHNQHVGAFLSKRVKRPVKIINTREEDTYASATRHGCLGRLKAGVTKDGRFVAFLAQVYLNTGAYCTHGPIVIGAQTRKFQYRVPHYRYEGHCVYSNGPVAGAMRGYGNPQINFGREIFIDKIAKNLGIDPLRFRMMNQLEVGERIPSHTFVLRSCAMKECVEMGEKIKAEIDEESSRAPDSEGVTEAWGVAFGCHTSGPSNNDGLSSSLIMVNDDGSVHLKVGAADMGQGCDTTLGQIAAEALSVDLEEVTVYAADTLHTPYDTGSFASSQIYVSGNAVRGAAIDVLEKLLLALAKRYHTSAEKIRYESGRFEIPSEEGESISLGFKEAVRNVSFGTHGAVIIGGASFKATESPLPFVACWAKVAVDTAKKTLRVKDLIEVVDVGTAINPQIVTGQVEGGMSMGIGFALMEKIEIDKRAGKPSSSDLLTYRIPTIRDMPRLHTGIVEGFEPTGAFGAKSVGELPAVPVAAAIVNAVTNATGEEIKRLPLTDLYISGNTFLDQPETEREGRR